MSQNSSSGSGSSDPSAPNPLVANPNQINSQQDAWRQEQQRVAMADPAQLQGARKLPDYSPNKLLMTS